MRRATFVRSTLGLTAARGIAGLLLFLATVVIARGSGASTLGIFGLTTTVGLYAATIADAGISVYLLPRLGQLARREWSSLWADALRFEVRSAVPASAIYVIAVGLSTSGEERLALLAGLPWWLLLRFSLATRAVFTAAERVGAEARATAAESALGLACVIAATLLTTSPAAPVTGLSVGLLLGCAIRIRGLASLGIERVRPKRAARNFGRVTFPFAAGTAFQILYLRVDIILLAAFTSPRELGLYQPAVRFAAAVILLPDALSSILLSRSARSPDDQRTRSRQEQLLAGGLVIGLAVVAAAALVGRWFLGLVFGAEFRQAWIALMLLSATPPLTFVAAVNGNALTARGFQRERVVCLIVASIMALGAGTPAVVFQGYNGAAVISVLNEVVLIGAYWVALTKRAGRGAVVVPRFRSRAVESVSRS